MSSSTVAAPPNESGLGKLFDFVLKEATIVEADVAKILGPDLTSKLEAIGKSLLSGEWGPLLAAAIANATDVVTGQMSVSIAIASLVALAEAEGKAVTKSAALQLIGLAQNVLPARPATVTPVA